MTEFNQICYWDSEKEESIRELVSRNLPFLLVINLNSRVIKEIEPFNLLKRLFDIGVKAIDFQKENSEIDTVAADKWLMRAYDDNEGSFTYVLTCLQNIILPIIKNLNTCFIIPTLKNSNPMERFRIVFNILLMI